VPLVLTYDNESLQDGLGSQALRILGIYSIAKVFFIRYQHTPIKEFIEERAHGLTGKRSESRLLNQVNEFFHFPSSTLKSNNFEILTMRNISGKTLLKLKLRHLFTRRIVVLRLLLPFNITDRLPRIYSIGVRHLRRQHRQLLVQKDITVVHVRRGYGYLYSEKSSLRPRHLPFKYYSSVLECVAKKKYGDTFQVIVHTDLSPTQTKWRPFQKKVGAAIERIQKTKSRSDGFNLPGVNLRETISFPMNAIVRIEYCSDFMKTFLDMCNCTILVQSKSSFSYLAGLVNSGLVIWPSSHGHSKKPGWLDSTELGLDPERFIPLIEGSPERL